eukprot:PITA_07244
MGRSSRRDELPLNLQLLLQPFEKWEIDFVGPIQPLGKKTGAWYIITSIEYLIRWVEVHPIKDYIGAAIVKFRFEYVLTKFSSLKILMSDCSMHFLNETISALMEEFQFYRQESTSYHPQASGMVEAFNKVLENVLTKFCNAQRNDWDVLVPVVLWAYITTLFIGMVDHRALEETLIQLTELEEDRFLAGFHKQFQKEREKEWHD